MAVKKGKRDDPEKVLLYKFSNFTKLTLPDNIFVKTYPGTCWTDFRIYFFATKTKFIFPLW